MKKILRASLTSFVNMKANMSRLIVVNGMPIDIDRRATIKQGQNTILAEYSKYWDEIIVVGPLNTKRKSSRIEVMPSAIAKNVFLLPLEFYNKSWNARLLHILFGGKRCLRFAENNCMLKGNNVFYFMLPNFWTLRLAVRLLPHVSNSCFYMASDIDETIYNRSLFLYPFARIITGIQMSLMKNKTLIATGHIIAEKYSNKCATHPYYSTTHNTTDRREPKNSYFNLLYVGGLYPHKRVIDLLIAVNSLKNDFAAIRCTIVGSGSEYENLKNYVLRNDLSEYVSFKGWINDRIELTNCYSKADFLITPSLAEGTPRVLPEAMSLGVIPIAVGSVSSNNHIITHRKNGALVAAKSPEDISNELRNYFNNPSLYRHNLECIYDYAVNHTLSKEIKEAHKFLFKHLEINSSVKQKKLNLKE